MTEKPQYWRFWCGVGSVVCMALFFWLGSQFPAHAFATLPLVAAFCIAVCASALLISCIALLNLGLSK